MTAPARPAATVVLLRDGGSGLELLMARRSLQARFLRGVWVFPGGAIDDADPSPEHTALRELVEELGIWLTTDGSFTDRVEGDVMLEAAKRNWRLDVSVLHWFATWVTPTGLPKRFDTRFFAAAADVEPAIDGEELIDAEWVLATEALRRAAAGTWTIPFPTRKTIELFAGFESAEAVIDYAKSVDAIEPVQPRLLVDADSVAILVQGDDGYEAAAVTDTDPELLDRIRTVIESGGTVPSEIQVPR